MQTESLITGMSNAAGSGKDDGTNAWHSRDGITDKVKIKKHHEFLNLSASMPSNLSGEFVLPVVWSYTARLSRNEISSMISGCWFGAPGLPARNSSRDLEHNSTPTHPKSTWLRFSSLPGQRKALPNRVQLCSLRSPSEFLELQLPKDTDLFCSVIPNSPWASRDHLP